MIAGVVQVCVIAAFLVLFLRDGLRGPMLGSLGAAWAAAGTLGGLAGVAILAHVLIWRLGRRMDRGWPGAMEAADRVVLASRVTALGIYALCVLGLGWLDAVRSVTGDLVLVDELAAALPFLLVLVGGWWSMAPLERRLREAVLVRSLDEGRPVHPIPSRGGYVLAAVRHQLALVVVPLALIMAWKEAVERAAGRGWLPEWAPVEVVQLAGAVGALILMPLLMRRVWDTVALGPGELRDELMAMCRVHGVRVRELLLWRTHGMMINGAVMGLVGPARYVMLTDALLERLPAEQVQAVMAHELGHIRRRHMPWLFAAAVLSIGLGVAGADVVLRLLGEALADREAAQVASVGVGMILGLVAFGFVSRRFEWQADAFAVQHLSGARPGDGEGVIVTPEAVRAMSGALESVAELNHIPRRRFAWRHGSIASRQERLAGLVGQPARRLRPDREAAIAKVAVGAAMVAVLIVMLAGLGTG
jgi:Zn-dependent protease with chaperone function